MYLRLITIIILLIISNSVAASIHEITNLDKLKSILKEHKDNMLIVFDVDNVLVMPTDEYTIGRSVYRKKLWKNIKNNLSKKEFKLIHSAMILSSEPKIVDTDLFDIFQYIKKNNIKATALTSIPTGKFGYIKNWENLREKQLLNLGINFAKISPFKNNIFLNRYKTPDGVPVLKSGIIYTADRDKGEILAEILRLSSYYPERIIFIDDQLHNILSVENLCNKLGIEFIGFHYTIASIKEALILDYGLEDIRMKILKLEHKWLSYTELNARISNK